MSYFQDDPTRQQGQPQHPQQQPQWGQQPQWNQHQPPGQFTPPPKLKLRPRGYWYLLGLVPLILGPIIGFVLAVGGVISGVVQAIDQIEPVNAAGVATVQLDSGDEAGVYGGSFTGSNAAAGCTVTDPRGNAVVTESTSVSSTVQTGSQEYTALGSFTAGESGTYTLRCPPTSVAAFGPDPDFSGLLGGAIAAVALIIGGPIVGLIIVLIIVLMRASSKRRQRREMGLA